MTHLRTSIFSLLVAVLLFGVHATEKICEDRTVVVSTSVWKPVGPVNKLACKKGAEIILSRLPTN
jgi:hypothetical protein